MFPAIHSKNSPWTISARRHHSQRHDACIALAEGIAGNERIFADMMTKRARELG